MRHHRLLSGALTAALALASPAAAASTASRYTLANGCWTLSDAAGTAIAQQVRLKATALGRYLLYTRDRRFLSAQSGGLRPADAPSPAADFAVAEAGRDAFTLAPQSTGRVAATARFAPATGCAAFPEAGLQASGTPSRGATAYGAVRGIVEGHMHWMAFQFLGGRFRCGKPWDPYGITYALPDCADREGPQGTADPVQNTLNYGNPAQAHPTANWPTFPNQARTNLTYEGMYYRWVQRVWKAGLRLMVMSVNENRVLCELQANRTESCDEMNTVRRGFRAIRELEDYVDAQAGGPGKGFFEVVTNPLQARRVINQGRMAVVLEIEVSEPFGCRGWQQVTCDRAQIRRQIEEMDRLGARSSLLLNKFDNPLTGVRFDSGTNSYLIDAGNKSSAGSYWDARTCTGPLHDNQIDIGEPSTSAAGASLLGALGVQGGTFPVYPPPPHCNTRGLTDLGRYALEQMMQRGWIVNPDHMSQAAVDSTLTLLEARRYSGVISPHGWVDPGNWPRLWKLGGLAFPGHSSTDAYVKDWRQYRPRQTPYAFGWGYGADLGGLSTQPDRSAKGAITYPFESYDGRVTFGRQRTGRRTFDFTKDGVAQYGLYADWLADLRRVGGPGMARDMMAGAEAYLEMWERASGIGVRACSAAAAVVGRRGLGPIRLGVRWEQLLRRAGQPQQRGRAWSWCVAGRRNRWAADVAVLSPGGVVELVGSRAYGRRAGGVAVGESARALGAPRSGLVVRRAGARAFAFALRGGTVRAVAVAGGRLAARPGALRAAVGRVLRARASSRARRFVPAVAQAGGRLLGRAAAAARDAGPGL